MDATPTVNVKIDTLAIIGCDEMFLVGKMKHHNYIYTFYKVKMLKYIDNVTTYMLIRYKLCEKCPVTLDDTEDLEPRAESYCLVAAQ